MPDVPSLILQVPETPTLTFFAVGCGGAAGGGGSFAGGVSSLNSLSGILNIVGAGSVFVTTNGQNIIVSGASSGAGGGGISQSQFDALSGFFTTGLFNTGARLYTLITGSSGSLIATINATGTYFNSQINSVSGWANNFSGVLQGQINIVGSASGVLQTQINTINTQITNINTSITSLSGFTTSFSGILQNQLNTLTLNLGLTGQTLTSNIAGLSGALNASGLLLATNLGLTGSNLYNLVTGLSGTLTGYATIPALFSLSGSLNNTGSNLYGFITGLSGVMNSANTLLTTNLFNTGSNLYNMLVNSSGYIISLISAASAGVSSINGSSGVITIGGAGGISVFTVGTNITVSGRDWLTTGAGDLRYYPFGSNPSGYITNGQTGQFASVTQLNSLSGFVVTTSGYLLSQIVATSGVLGLSLATTGVNLYNLITGLSGQSVTNYATIANLALTGANLYALITGSSGAQNLNIAATGSNLYNLIFGLSGAHNAAIAASGSLLYNLIVGLSGVVPTIKVTGSNNILAVNITGIGGTTVSYSGGFIFISSSATATGGGGGSAGVSSVNGITGQVFIAGTGGTQVTTIGNTIYIAGGSSGSNVTINGSGEIHFVTGILTTGFKEYWIQFPQTFDILPRIFLTQQFRSQGDTAATFYNHGISGKTTSGFYLMLSDIVRNTGLVFDVLAKTSTGGNLITGGSSSSIPATPMRFGLSLDNGTSDVTTGYKGWFQLSSAMSISGWNIISVQSGNIMIDILKSTFALWPNDAVSIITGIKPGLNGLRTGFSVNITGWNTTIHEGEYLQFVVRAVTGIRKFNVNITGMKV